MNVLHQLIDSLPASWTPAERERRSYLIETAMGVLHPDPEVNA